MSMNRQLKEQLKNAIKDRVDNKPDDVSMILIDIMNQQASFVFRVINNNRFVLDYVYFFEQEQDASDVVDSELDLDDLVEFTDDMNAGDLRYIMDGDEDHVLEWSQDKIYD